MNDNIRIFPTIEVSSVTVGLRGGGGLGEQDLLSYAVMIKKAKIFKLIEW